MLKRRQRIRNQPNTAEQPIDISTPSGADQDAFCVSSERCALFVRLANSVTGELKVQHEPCIEAGNGILRHENTDAGNVC